MGKREESKFFNEAYSESSRRNVWKYYALIDCSRHYYRSTLLEGCRGKHALEYGCGVGSYAYDLARGGATVIGIDISDVAIEKATERANRRDLTGLSFIKMDAENMTFPDGHFDIVCGTGILHHLQLESALGELVRVLKPSGRAQFLEPLGHNPAINLFRMLTPHLRTRDEHPLTAHDLIYIRQQFRHAEIRYFALFSFLSLPWLKTRVFPSILAFFEKLDSWIFKSFPCLGRYAWYAAIVLEEPIRPGTVSERVVHD